MAQTQEQERVVILFRFVDQSESYYLVDKMVEFRTIRDRTFVTAYKDNKKTLLNMDNVISMELSSDVDFW